MKNQLKQIQTSFNKASLSYESVASAQKQTAEFLTDKLLKTHGLIPKTVLDVGTGTGYIPQMLLPKFKHSLFYLNDISQGMLDVCKDKFKSSKNIYYLQGDMLKLNSDIYECVISNLALQWAWDLEYALKLLHSKSSNVFAFSTLLDGTFKEWENIINQYQSIKLMNYPTTTQIINLCNNLKKDDQTFNFWLMDIHLSFENSYAFIRYLKLLGASNSSSSMHLCNLKKLLKKENQDFITVTYKIFFGIFSKIN